MIKYQDIQEEVESAFQNFMIDLLGINDQKQRYYYWTIEYLKTIGGLSFQYFPLNINQKDRINELGLVFFESENVYFEINKNSHRHDITIKNINKLFSDETMPGQSSRYEYLKEFILWQFLDKLSKSSKLSSTKIAEIQKKNFLYTYVNYLVEHTKMPAFKGYIQYIRTQQGEDLLKKIEKLEVDGHQNESLLMKIKKLYILKEEEAKIHFVFSRNGGEEKEELRELLDVMGRPETGKLYRGQANSTWKLDASITREPKYLENESEMYYEILSLKPDAFVNDRTVYERLITMQHFGMPTRLLDITRNPLVAIFFACDNMECTKNDGVVFTFSPNKEDVLNFEDPKLESLKKLFDKNGNGRTKGKEVDELLSSIWFIKGIANNQRINNQSGDFIFVGNGKDISQDLYNLPPLTIIIDSYTKATLLEQLESLNIHGGAVYPDLTHLSAYISNKYRNGKAKFLNENDVNSSPFDEKKKTTKQSSLKKPVNQSEVKQLSTEFNSNSFWTDERTERLTHFALENDVKEDLVLIMAEDLIAYEKEPLRNDLIEALNTKPLLRERVNVAEDLAGKIKALADELNTPKV